MAASAVPAATLTGPIEPAVSRVERVNSLPPAAATASSASI